MMNDDKLFRDRLYNVEASYPDDMWDRISTNLPRKRRIGGVWFFLLLAFILIGFMAGILIPSLERQDNNAMSDVEFINHSSAGEIDDLRQEEKSKVTTLEEEIQSDREGLNGYPLIAESISPALHEMTEVNAVHNTPSSDTGSSPSTAESTEDPGPFSVINQTDVSGYVKVFPDINSGNIPFSEIGESLYEERTSLAVPGSIEPIGIAIKYGIPEFEQPECPSFGFDRESGIFFDLLYSHDLPQRSLTSKSQELNEYVNSRNNTESTLYSFSATLRIAYISESGFGLKTGFNYSQINEKFEFLDPDASLIRTIITIDTLIVGGVPTVVTDTSTIRIPGSLDITTYNRYRFFDIPLLATYEAPISEKFSYSVNGGVLLNLAFRQKGRFLDPSDMPVWFSGSEPDRLDAFSNSAGLSLFGSLGLHYSLNEHLDIILEPNFRLFAGSLTTEPYPLEQKWLTLGLSHGIRYKF